MSDAITAADLLLPDFLEIRGDQTLGEAMAALVDVQGDPAVPNALVVRDADGRYEGFLTARLLIRSLLALWMPEKAVREDDQLLNRELLEVVRGRLDQSVRDALIRGLPTARREDRLLDLIELAIDKQLEFVPVVAEDRAIGLVPVTAIFQAAAGLALTPEHEGIRFDQPEA